MATESEQCVDELLKRSKTAEDLLQKLEDDYHTKQVDDARTLVRETQSYIDNNRSIIPSFILKQVSDALRKLESHINSSSKSKLNFKFKTKPTNSNEPKTPSLPTKPPETIETIAGNFFGFQKRNGESLSLGVDDCQTKDISLVDLEDCAVNICGLANTVYIRNLRNTTVTIFLACRAITVKGCIGCRFSLVCQQLRIDSTTDCEFHIFTSARSMLEASKNLIFKELRLDGASRFNLPAETLQRFLTQAKFNPSKNNWQCIDDFDWLSPDVPSKNYRCQQV